MSKDHYAQYQTEIKYETKTHRKAFLFVFPTDNVTPRFPKRRNNNINNNNQSYSTYTGVLHYCSKLFK